MRKKILIGLLLSCCAAFAGLWILFSTMSFSGPLLFDDSERIEAEREFYQTLDSYTCLTTDDLRAESAARDWEINQSDGPSWCITDDGITDWLSVEVRPSFSFSTEDENRRYFGFGTEGCRIKWTGSDCS